jgi:aldehyde dehydrogenase (NAD+)
VKVIGEERNKELRPCHSGVSAKRVDRDSTPAFVNIFNQQRVTAIELRTTSAAERTAKLRRLEASVLKHKDAIYRALMMDLRKPEAEVDISEIMPVIGEIHHACGHLASWMRPRRISPTLAMLGTQARLRYEPKGVTLVISPWNYPLSLTLGPLVSAIAAGNTAILKPSELSPACSAVIGDIVAECFDPSEVALFQGDAKLSTELLELPFDHIFFTGSPTVGKVVMAAASRHLSSITLELGGKSPGIVDESANITKAAKSIMWGKFLNNGQTCIAPDYLYVHEAVLQEFLDAAVAAIAKMFGLDARNSPDYGRIINSQHFSRIADLLDNAIANGATLITGGEPVAEDRFIPPTLLTEVGAGSLVLEQEIFGPLLPIRPYRDINQVIAHVNSAQKPLAFYIFAQKSELIEKILAETSSGGACINATLLQFSHNNLPFGGVNNSGLGSSHGVFGFRAFSHERAVLHDKMSLMPMLFPPYTPRVKKMIKLIQKYFV